MGDTATIDLLQVQVFTVLARRLDKLLPFATRHDTPFNLSLQLYQLVGSWQSARCIHPSFASSPSEPLPRLQNLSWLQRTWPRRRLKHHWLLTMAACRTKSDGDTHLTSGGMERRSPNNSFSQLSATISSKSGQVKSCYLLKALYYFTFALWLFFFVGACTPVSCFL